MSRYNRILLICVFGFFAIAATLAERLGDGIPSGALSTTITPTKGSLWVANGTNFAPLTVGPDTQVLTADSTQTLGAKWAVPTTGAPTITSTHGTVWQLQSIEEEIVIANAATTSSTGNLMPANSIIYGVTARVTGALLNGRTWQLGVNGLGPNQWAQAGQSGALGTLTNTNFTGSTSPGGPSGGPLAPVSTVFMSSQKVLITLSNADGGDGATTKIRVCVIYSTLGNLAN